MPVRIDWQNQTEFSVDRRQVEQHLNLILRRLGHVGMVNIEINLVGEQAITKLNNQFRNTNQPTDVLSFPAVETVAEETLLGSIAVCPKIAVQQASEAGITTDEEINNLVGHGLLHLLGFHHR